MLGRDTCKQFCALLSKKCLTNYLLEDDCQEGDENRQIEWQADSQLAEGLIDTTNSIKENERKEVRYGRNPSICPSVRPSNPFIHLSVNSSIHHIIKVVGSLVDNKQRT